MAETSASATGSKLKYEEDALLRALHGVKGSLVTSGVDSYRSRIGQSNIFLWRSRESGGNIYYEFREEESSKSAIKPLQVSRGCVPTMQLQFLTCFPTP